MLIHTQMKHDITCWMIAIGLHLLLFLVNFNLSKTLEAEKLVPIVEVEYVAPEEIIGGGRAGSPGSPAQTFKEKIRKFFRVKEVVPAKKEEVLAGGGTSKPEVTKIEGLSNKEILVDKQGSLSKKFELSKVSDQMEELISKSKEDKILLASKELTLKDSKLENLEDKTYEVAKKDLPFHVATKEEISGNEADIVDINLGKKTSKDIFTNAPTLKDIKEGRDFSEGVFRIVKKEAQGKLTGTEVLASLLAMAKVEEAKKLEGYGNGLGPGGTLNGKEGYEGIGGSGIGPGIGYGAGSGTGYGAGSGEGFGTAGRGSVYGVIGGEGIGTGGMGGEGSSSGAGSGTGSLKEAKSEGKGKGTGATFRRGVVFSRASGTEPELAGYVGGDSGSGKEAGKGGTRKEQKGTVIFEIVGSLSQRAVLRKVIPSYPEWAEKEGIEAGVSVYFVVLSDGKVKDNIYVVKTSGYPAIDKLVMEALRYWQFSSLKGDQYGKEEWGVLTFYFSLAGGT